MNYKYIEARCCIKNILPITICFPVYISRTSYDELVTQVEMPPTVLRTPILLFIRLYRLTSIVLSFVGANLFL